jgi:hypothetical protein
MVRRMENHTHGSFVKIDYKYNPPPLSAMQARKYNYLTSHLLYLLPLYLVDAYYLEGICIESNPTKDRQFCVLSNLLLREWGGGGVLCPLLSDFKVLGEGRARSHKGMSPQRRGYEKVLCCCYINCEYCPSCYKHLSPTPCLAH